MNRQYKQALIILALLVSVPVIVFAVYEYSSITREEKLVAEVYETQLNSILFSINLYSEDIISTWQLKLSSQGAVKDKEKLTEFIKENPSIKFLYSYDTENNKTSIRYNEKGKNVEETETLINSILKNNSSKIDKLFGYLKSGYRKAEPINDTLSSEITHILYASTNGQEKIISGIGIDSKEFINKSLKPRLQVIAQEKLVISIFNKRTGEKVYSNFPGEKGEARNDKMLWLLPGFEMAIKPLNTTIENIANKRKQENLIITGVLALLLSAGAIFLLRNIRKEMKLSEIKSEFVSNVSHELRTPLTLIKGYSTSLLRQDASWDKDTQRDFLQIIDEKTDELRDLIDKLLQSAKLEAGALKLEKEPVLIPRLAQKIKEEITTRARKHQITLDFAPSFPVVEADVRCLEQVLRNLVENAVKYSREGSVVTIGGDFDGDKVVVSVNDDGQGIPVEHQGRLFERFYRVDSPSNHGIGGSGLGLSIVKGHVEAHGGKVWLESAAGKGSHFFFSLPLEKNGNSHQEL